MLLCPPQRKLPRRGRLCQLRPAALLPDGRRLSRRNHPLRRLAGRPVRRPGRLGRRLFLPFARGHL